MKSVASRRFWEAFSRLPEPVRAQARRAYLLFEQNPGHPGLRFKKIHEEGNVYSARAGLGYRALGRLEGDTVIWFWIGPHTEYDRLVRSLD